MREGRRQRLGLQEGTEGTVEDTYLDRILEQEGPRTLALDPDAFVDTTDQRYVQDAYNYYLGGGFPQEEPVIDTPVIDTTPVVDAGGGGGIDQATGDVDTTPTDNLGFDADVTPGPSGFIGLDPDMDVDPQDFAQEDYGMYETPGGQATPGAEFADQNPYGGTGTLDDLGADTFDDFDSGPQPGISNPRAPGQDTVTQDTTIDTTPTAPPGILNPYQEPMTQQDLIDSDANVGFVEQTFEADDIDEQGNLLEKGIAKIESLGFNPLEIAGKFALNSFIGKPITLAFDAVKAVAGMLPDGIEATTDKAREIGLIQGDNTVTQDIYGINTQSMFGDYNQYNIDRVEQLEDKVNKTPRDIIELQQRKDYIDSSGALGDINLEGTGDASVAEDAEAGGFQGALDARDDLAGVETGDAGVAEAEAAADRARDAAAAANAAATAAAQRELNRISQYNRGNGGGGGGGGSGDSNSPGGGGSYCFDPSTFIQMADGSTKKIKDIQLGDDTKGGEVTGVFQFKASDEIHDYKGVTVAGSHYVKENGKFIMVKDSPLAVKIDKIPVVYSLDTSGRRIFIKDIEFADYNGDGIAKGFLHNAGVPLEGFDKEVLRQVQQRLI